ncbi:hypothetical protein [Latilactobacillus curvatus]|uniref:hypothetical protein n=1 Tax=Latilactobacillus curvatus TaxID=28038 RepID=UPI000A1AB7F3|nr:hypothetical protein [Latilactobacillus curvatus]MDG2977286.1 hypothetical protein [Latilactobacillus curvatus]MDG2981587.1 hypothetical protein [Latilactobacillus curvatus]SMH68043.1 putative membrane protein [Latilactobacillus curvatus]
MPVLIIILGFAFIFQKPLMSAVTIVFGALFGLWLLRGIIVLMMLITISHYWRQKN